MKRFLSLFLFFALTASLLLRFSPHALATQGNMLVQPSPSPTPTFVQYDLAYPGILPDHPLYKLKVLRDKMIAFFTRDVNRKTLFYLQQADKGILAAAMLVDKGNIDLAGQTALKAEHNMTLITQYLQWLDLKKNPDMLIKLKTASRKHGEVLVSLIKRLPESEQQTFTIVQEFSQRNLQTIEQFETEIR